MTEKPRKQESLSPGELEAQQGQGLPDREEMSLVDANAAVPANVAAALNVASDDATAIANAEQDVTIDQSNQ